jgi:hypothetical protein
VNIKLSRKTCFPSDVEADLAYYCIIMEHRFFGMSRKNGCRLAFQTAKRNGIENPFSKGKEAAGRRWLKQFLHRNHNLATQTPQVLSFSRAKVFTPDVVTKFFDLFEPEMELIKHAPNRLYNCDESGITIVHYKHRKLVALKGKHQICSLQAAEGGCLITVVTCNSRAGHYIPPLIIFPRNNIKIELVNGAPPGSIYACHPSGRIQTDLFTQWFRYFIQHVKPTEEHPAVLVLMNTFHIPGT